MHFALRSLVVCLVFLLPVSPTAADEAAAAGDTVAVPDPGDVPDPAVVPDPSATRAEQVPELPEAPPEAVSESDPDAPWAPPAPSPSSKDWVRMKSGEWLRGDLEQIHDGDVKFDSKELDDLELDWGDISEIRCPRRHTYRFVGKRIVTGTAMMKDGVIRIDTGTEVRSFDRKELVTMMEGEPKEINYWSLLASLGFIAKSGNTQQSDLTATLELIRRTALTRTYLTYSGTFASVDGTETANNHLVRTGFDYFITRRLFLQLPFFEFYRDPFTNIAARLSPGVGLGYDVFANKWVDWEVSAGGAYQYSEFESVQPGEAKNSHDAAVAVGTVVKLDITKNLDWDTDWQIALVATDFDQSNSHLRSTISFDVWGPLDFDTSFNWDFVKKPQRRVDGSRPKSSDFRISIGFGIDI